MAALLLASLARPGVVSAQVMEINQGGEVTVYDRPSVFDGRGATPIGVSTTQPLRRSGRRSSDLSALSDAAAAARLSPDLLEAVAWRESRFRAGVVSRAGAIGEMQLMPATAQALRVDPYDSRQNYRGGATYLSALLRRYDGDLMRALAAYNAGPGAVDRWGGVPPYKETQAYVAAILERLSQTATSFVQADARR